MKTMTITFYVLSALLLVGAVSTLVKLASAGMYPPKRVLKQRARSLALGGIFLFFIGAIFSLFK